VKNFRRMLKSPLFWVLFILIAASAREGLADTAIYLAIVALFLIWFFVFWNPISER
jgi:hypothetical protein